MIFTTLWKDAESSLLEKLDRNTMTLEFKRGDVIYSLGDHPRGLYVVISGLIGLSIIGEESGKEHLLRFFTSGQVFGHRALFSEETYHASAVALEKTTLKLIPKAILVQFLDENPILYKDMVKYMGKELRRAENLHVMILENQILPRTAQALIYLKNLHPEHNWTRSEIANFTASTTSTIIKAMAQLEEMGLIRQTGRSIEILNKEELLKLQNMKDTH